MKRWGVVLSIFVLSACSRGPGTSVKLRLWHFWSEPRQERALKQIVRAFHHANPDIDIELVPLQWSDGRAKLQIAFTSGQTPDIVHIGSEWVTEFAPVLTELDSSVVENVLGEFTALGCVGNNRYAVPWTVNARVMFVHLELDTSKRWDTFIRRIQTFHDPPRRIGIGLCTSDPHNVLKRVLPFLWACGSSLMQFLPFSATVDAAAVVAFGQLQQLADYAIIESSRQLDARLRRGELGAVLSGVWMLNDSSVTRQYRILSHLPVSINSVVGATILSSDCFAITRSTPFLHYAKRFVAYMMQWRTAAEFCRLVPDAGLPAFRPPSKFELDTLLMRSPHWLHVYRQMMHARILPTPSYYLEAERVAEEIISKVLYHELSPQQAAVQLRREFSQIEDRFAQPE